METAWHRADTSVVGQIVEFLVWVELAAQSEGRLHVYLPIWDRGIDAVIRRRTDGAYIPVQVKGRSELQDGEVHLVVRATGLVDDDALLIAGLLDGDRLGPKLLVVDERTFKKLAFRSHDDHGVVFAGGFAMKPRRNSRWLPHLVGREDVAARLGGGGGVEGTLRLEQEEPETDPQGVGRRGEAELVRRLAEVDELNLFRPFPDLETAELVVRHVATRRILGLQVKAVGVDSRHPEASVTVARHSFRPAADIWMVVLGWLRKERRFHEECLLIPSNDVESLAAVQGNHLRFHYRPGGRARSRLDPYRQPLAQLGGQVAKRCGNP